MIIYVVTHEPYHDNSCVLGSYSTLEKAKASLGEEWFDAWNDRDEYGRYDMDQDGKWYDNSYRITETELDKLATTE